MSPPLSPVPHGHYQDSSEETNATTATLTKEFSLPEVTHLTDKYPNTCGDFYSSSTPCVFKSGPNWHVPKGPHAQRIVSEARPVYRQAIGSTWLSIGKRIYQGLDSIDGTWTSINPLANSDVEKAEPFCSLILSIGVKLPSFLYDVAVAAAAVKEILAEAGFPITEVAFAEPIVTRSVAAGPEPLSFEPLLDDVPDLRKPFTTALGLSIAPLKHHHFEGTAALYFRLGKDDKRTAILTCAHVARPPPIYADTGMTRRKETQAREEFVALGNSGYSNAVKAMIGAIGDLVDSIAAWNGAFARLGKPVEREQQVTKHRTTPDQRVPGFMLHSERIKVSVEPHNFARDWALIELNEEKIDWSTFKGNKVYVGGNLSTADLGNTMFAQPVDRPNCQYPKDGRIVGILTGGAGLTDENDITYLTPYW